MKKVRKEYHFYGRVQGVGFRFHLEHGASLYGLTGWVRNEYDGSVTAQFQGEYEGMRQLLKFLYADRYIEIEDVEVKSLPLRDEERGFQIKF